MSCILTTNFGYIQKCSLRYIQYQYPLFTNFGKWIHVSYFSTTPQKWNIANKVWLLTPKSRLNIYKTFFQKVNEGLEFSGVPIFCNLWKFWFSRQRIQQKIENPHRSKNFTSFVYISVIIWHLELCRCMIITMTVYKTNYTSHCRIILYLNVWRSTYLLKVYFQYS